MREGIGSVVLYNIIIIFIVITFGFLSASLSYMKAFKVNGRIANILEKYEGYNWLSDREIAQTLNSIGYRIGEIKCPQRSHNGVLYSAKNPEDCKRKNCVYKQHQYCIYEYMEKSNGDYKNGYFTYGILTYLNMDVPIIGGFFRLPVYSETETIYKFSAD